jgi:hypothetical protein
MWWKSREIDKLAGKPMGYMTKKDVRAIAEWDEDKAKTVWLGLILSKKYYVFLDSVLCPFCIIYKDNCFVCCYKDVHGTCLSYGSTYKNILMTIKKDSICETISFKKISVYLKNANRRLQSKIKEN